MKFATTDRTALVRAVADTIVAAVDPVAQECGIFYSMMARPWIEPVLDSIRRSAVPQVRAAGLALLSQPADARHYLALRAALVDAFDDPAVVALCQLAWEAEGKSRIGVHFGADYDQADRPVNLEALLQRPSILAAPVSPDVLVVVPFQGRGESGLNRLRNLIACLQSLRDQSYPRNGYRVVVVESDAVQRHRNVIEPYCDEYLFARNPGLFNKSWIINVGVVRASGNPEITCILDADVLTDRDFVARNAERFLHPGRGGHFPHRNMLCMDRPATSWAIRQRLLAGAAEPPLGEIRGFLLRKSPGCCIWVRTEAFLRVGGFDERYEGWGGEDYDFFRRLDIATPIDHFHDTLLHMHHPPSSRLNDDGSLVTSHITPLSWEPGQDIGRLDKFDGAAD
jgi:hypothetical protein